MRNCCAGLTFSEDQSDSDQNCDKECLSYFGNFLPQSRVMLAKKLQENSTDPQIAEITSFLHEKEEIDFCSTQSCIYKSDFRAIFKIAFPILVFLLVIMGAIVVFAWQKIKTE